MRKHNYTSSQAAQLNGWIPWRSDLGLVALTVMGWLTCTAAQVEKFLPPRRAALVCLLGCAFVVATMFVLRRANKKKRDISRWTLVVLYAVLALSFAVLYPKSLNHTARKGSDREDALRVELIAVIHHRYPYSARTFRNNPPTPLPGALWLAAPFFYLGRIAFQNLFWAAAFMVLLCRCFRRRATAFAFVLLFLLTALENLNDFDVGGDYIANLMYISVAVYLFTRIVERRRASWLGFLSVTLLGVSLSSRIIYVVVLFPLCAFTWQRTSPRRTIILFSGVLAAAAMATFPVFLPHPASRFLAQLVQNADKFQALPRYLPGKLLPPLAMLIAASSFFVSMSLMRIYLISGMATLAMLLPPMAGIVAAQGGLLRPLSPDVEYLSVSVLFVGLWVFSKWERGDTESTVEPLGRLAADGLVPDPLNRSEPSDLEASYRVQSHFDACSKTHAGAACGGNSLWFLTLFGLWPTFGGRQPEIPDTAQTHREQSTPSVISSPRRSPTPRSMRRSA